MTIKDLGTSMDRQWRIDLNDNFRELSGMQGSVNDAVNKAETAEQLVQEAKTTANNANNTSNSVQEQLNQIVIEGDSSVEAAQARIEKDGTVHETLKKHTDAIHEKIDFLQETGRNVRLDGAKPIEEDISFDSTAAIQTSLNSYKNVFIPDGTFLVDPVISLFIKSNSKVTFSKNAIIKSKTTNVGEYNIISLKDVSNVELINPNIIGDRDTHVGTAGEWGHGINIQGSSNITIQNPNISKCWGDGIYIGSTAKQNYCSNVMIINPLIDSCRRQGISVISAKTLRINDGIIKNISGTPPASGIDLEPNFNSEFLQDIVIDNLQTENCDGAGIEIFGGAYANSLNKVSVTILNHKDTKSKFGAYVRRPMHNVEGFVNIEKPNYRDNRTATFLAEMWAYNAPKVTITEPYVENSPSNMGVFWIGATDSTTADLSLDVGNVHIINPKVVGSSTPRCVYYGVPSKFRNLINCSLINPVKLDNANGDSFLAFNTYFGMSVQNFILEDRNKILTKNITSDLTMDTMYCFKKITNIGASSFVRVIATMFDGQEVTLENSTSVGIAFLHSGAKILPDITTTGGMISTTQIGATITLRKKGSDLLIVNKSGNWTSQLSNKGTITYNGDGVVSKSIPHGLGVIPSYWIVNPTSYDAGTAGIKYTLADATNIYVYFSNAPISGTNNIILKWRADV
ncbi:right-handed parallel beta-helix repeat-containing protein [Bacillus toyonensis]|uniref:right-handed parallel beta-helix repeat-containing protein n=1 Tax=Bacillus toyonensis TaxID=155322 RepID=UPI000BF15226|nr:right-handed parallel beta-helix repeat-containing protein [Bacillus toyonensis]PEI49954.1 hypothetical protein CN631_15930 [Bacillus toyonensis]